MSERDRPSPHEYSTGWRERERERETYSAVLDNPGCAHGGKATEEGTTFLVETVGLHL